MNISDLITHIRAGTATAIMFHNALPDHAADCISAYGGSIDAAVRLCEATLTGWGFMITAEDATVYEHHAKKIHSVSKYKVFTIQENVPARALLIVTLMAWEAGNV
jgi:hypothetical protein